MKSRIEALGILGLTESATSEDIKKAYRKLIIQHHPDKHHTKEEQEIKRHAELFRKIHDAHKYLIEGPTANDSTTSFDAWFESVFQFPEKSNYLNALSELLKVANLDPNHIHIFKLMDETELEFVHNSLSRLHENNCLNEESFHLACDNISWPGKREFDLLNPMISKYIFEALVKKQNLAIPSHSQLNNYNKLLETFEILSGIDDGIQVSENLATQERLNQLMHFASYTSHPGFLNDYGYMITRLHKVDLLTPENEAFILEFLSKMKENMFSTLTYSLLHKDRAETIKILDNAREELNWAAEREQTIVQRQVVNLNKIRENQEAFTNQFLINSRLSKDLSSFKEKYNNWYDKERLFAIVEIYLQKNFVNVEQLNSFNYLLIGFFKESINIMPAVANGLVKLEDLNEICEWCERNGTYNTNYLEKLLSDEGLELLKKGIFTVNDVYHFNSSRSLYDYIEKEFSHLNQQKEQATKQTSVSYENQAATQIQALIRGHLSRTKSSLFHKEASAQPILEEDMPKHFRKSAAIGDIETCRELLKTKPSLVDMPGPDSGKTALHWAAEKGQVDMVYFLLEHKASLLEDNHGLTAYDVSKVPEIRRLLSYHFKDYFMNQAIKHTPITEKEAIQYGFKLPEEVLEDFWDVLQSKSLVDFHEMLKYHHLSVNNYMNGMPMMMILICVENIDPHKNIAFIDYFIEHKVDLNLKAHPRQYDAYEGTVLHSLLANENIKTTLYILQKAREEGLSINPTIRDVEGKTIVLIGALLRDTKFVSACLEQFGNSAIDIPDDMGRTPLHYAYLFGDKPMVDLLLRHGAHSECLDKNNKRPIDMLDENQQALLASFRKFHINAATRLVSDNLTLLEKCMSDRKELRHIVEQEPYLSSQKKSPN